MRVKAFFGNIVTKCPKVRSSVSARVYFPSERKKYIFKYKLIDTKQRSRKDKKTNYDDDNTSEILGRVVMGGD